MGRWGHAATSIRAGRRPAQASPELWLFEGLILASPSLARGRCPITFGRICGLVKNARERNCQAGAHRGFGSRKPSRALSQRRGHIRPSWQRQRTFSLCCRDDRDPERCPVGHRRTPCCVVNSPERHALRFAYFSNSHCLQYGTCAVIKALNKRPWLGTRRWSSSCATTKS